MAEPLRPSPDALLRQASRDARGRLKIFLGAAPGVGKTFEMLAAGAARLRAGTDVVAAVVETHGRADTQAQLAPFEQVPLARVEYQGHVLHEMDLDAVLARRPALALVDEFAHSNTPGSRHPKRWQDVVELLDAGIDVHTTLNIQHVESLNDVVASFTHVRVRETVPDRLLDDADIELIDLPPDELIERLRDGKVYMPEEAGRALAGFFSKANLSALRELALRTAADRVDAEMLEHLDARALPGVYGAAERVLVAVSEQQGAEALVRAAKRLADALHAPWHAIFIETPRAARFGEAEKAAVAAVLRLAASLGATIATVPAFDVTAGLRAHMQAMRATQLVIGRSRRSWWFQLRHRSVVEMLVKSDEQVAVHVIPSSGAAPVRSSGPTRAAKTIWPGYALAVGAVAATTVLARLALPLVGTDGIDLLYLLPVVLVAGRFGLLPGLATGLLAAFCYNYFFLAPLYTLFVANPQSLFTLGVFVLLATATSELAGRLRGRAILGTRGAEESAAVAAYGQMLARANDWETTGRSACDEFARLLDVSAVLLRVRDGALAPLAGSAPDTELQSLDLAAAEWCAGRGDMAGTGTGTLGASDWTFYPLATSLGVLAVLGLSRFDGIPPVTPDREVLLATLIGQTALALERLRLEEDVRDVSVLRERDRLRGALLSSIGHDLRTPLTAVGGALDAIAAQHPDAAALPVARSELLRLRRFLEDLLAMVRADTGALDPTIEPVDLLDAVGLAAGDVREVLRGNRLAIDLPDDLPLVQADSLLLHHILINLLINASRHGGPDRAIVVEAARRDDRLVLTIADDGDGFPHPPGTVFDVFAQGHGDDRHGGSGLGLAIVKTFADAMRIELEACNRPSGGAEVRLLFASPGATRAGAELAGERAGG